jgi:ribonuclease HI
LTWHGGAYFAGKRLIAYTDGSCPNNGNQGSSAPRAGFGVYWEDGELPSLSGPVVQGEQTNNRGELTAIDEAIKQVRIWLLHLISLVSRLLPVDIAR